MELFDMGPTEVLQAFCVQFVTCPDHLESFPNRYFPGKLVPFSTVNDEKLYIQDG
ncbi:hypothetical protein ACOSQ2_004710 [Xanthoceras sorbifolium]